MSKINYMHLAFGDCYINEYSLAPDLTQAYVYLNSEFIGKIQIKEQDYWITVPVNAHEDRI